MLLAVNVGMMIGVVDPEPENRSDEKQDHNLHMMRKYAYYK